MYLSFHSAVCFIACCGLSVAGLPASACFGKISNRQEEPIDDSDDQPQRMIEKIIVEPLQMDMELLPEDFDRRRPGAGLTSIRDGVATTTAQDANRNIKIMEDLKTGIVVEVTRNYGPQDIHALKKTHPNLVDYVEMFPDRVDNHEIELNLAIKTVYRSPTLAELKERHPEAFNIYRRYHAIPKERIR